MTSFAHLLSGLGVLFWLGSAWGAPPAAAAAAENKKPADMIPLFFQADKNNIQILPQRFEYNLVDEDHIKIGDISIDPGSFGFQVSSAAVDGKYRARFIWPSGLLTEGSLLLRDNTGKNIWSLNFNRQRIHFSTPANKNGEGDPGRTQVAEIIVDDIPAALIEDMKVLPFMSFCIFRTNLDTRIFLCSKELYLGRQNDRMGIRSRSQGKRAAFVEINGKSVSNQGVIYLNDENENIGFRAMTQSGAVLEIETRMKKVDFKDVVESDDKKNLIITASGTSPVNEDKVRKLSDDTWQFQLDTERPVLYLKGEGDIPMRQEFYVKGAVPSEKYRPYVDKDSLSHIYRSHVELIGKAAQGTSVGVTDGSQNIEHYEKNRFHWFLQDIPAGEVSRHDLRVSADNQSYIASYDLRRDFSHEVGLLGTYELTAGQIYARFFANWWFEAFLTEESDWARLHWGLHFEERALLNKQTGQANLNISHLELQWRAHRGFHDDPTWGLLLPVEMVQAPGVNLTTFGLGYFYNDTGPKNYASWMEWYDLRFSYFLGGTSGDIKLSNAYRFEAYASKHWQGQWDLHYGVEAEEYSFDGGDNKLNLGLTGGASYRF